MLEYPLTDAVPSIVHVKDRLLGKIHSFRADRAAVLGSIGGPSGPFDPESRPLTSHTQDLSPRDTRPTFQGIIEAQVQQQRSPSSPSASRAAPARGGRDMGPDEAPDMMQGSMHGGPLPSQAQALIVEEHDYALLYAYTLVTAQIAKELTVVQKEVEGLFGVLSEDSMLLQ
jgi:hypothetical protein